MNVLIDEINGGLGVIVRNLDPEEASERRCGESLREAFLNRHVLCLFDSAYQVWVDTNLSSAALKLAAISSL